MAIAPRRAGDKLDHGWPESRTSQARSAQRCRVRSFSLHFVKQARDSTRQGALRKLVGASWSAQVALRKLHCASCSAQVAPRKLVPASGSLQVALCKLRSLQVALCKLLCASCSAQVALHKLLCASCSRQGALRKAQVALCKLLCASCFKTQVASCDARPRTREESNPRPAGPGAGARTTRQLPRTTKDATNLEFLHLDHADSCRGLREHRRNRKKPRVFAPRPGRFPQRPQPQKSQKPWVFAPRPRRGCASTAEIAKNHGFLHLDHADPRRGSRGNFSNRKNHGFLHLDHADPRRGSRGNFRNRRKNMGF